MASRGAIAPETSALLDRWLQTGRLLVLVTGGTFAELMAKLKRPEKFSVIVGENGCVMTIPGVRGDQLLARPVPNAISERLRDRGISPLIVGRVVVSTKLANEEAVTKALAGAANGLQF